MGRQPKLEKLFQPVKIGTLEIKNRVVMPPMGTNLATKDGYVTDTLVEHYAARARGGVGLIIVEITCIDFPLGKAIPNQLSVDNDKYIPGLARLVAAVKQHGAKIALQLHHAGNSTKPEITGLPPVAPSGVARPGYPVPKELTKAEIEHIIELYAKAAARARQAGFDGVEIHGAHSYLVTQFLSRAWNRRQDEYGGSLENRVRFVLGVLKAVREKVGMDYPVWCRLNGKEYCINHGITLAETVAVSWMLERAGCDAIHVSAWGQRSYAGLHRGSYYWLEGHLAHLAAAVKKSVGIPVIAIGRLNMYLAERLLRQGKADLVALGRPLLAEPDLVAKAASDLSGIRPCLACNTCGDTALWAPPHQIRCSVNAALGQGPDFLLKKTVSPKKVMVIGGGPAGMEAARTAALRGHDVVLYEKAPSLGGRLILAAVPPHKELISALISYFNIALVSAGAKTELSREASLPVIKSVHPEEVVIATGGRPLLPEIPGLVPGSVLMADDVLSGKAQAGESVIIIGGEVVACELADFLSEKGVIVTLARRGAEMATRLPWTVRLGLMARLKQRKVDFQTGVKYIGIDGGSLQIEREGRRHTLRADNIIVAAGYLPDRELYETVKADIGEVYLAGDCAGSGDIRGAIADGARIGRDI